MAALDTIRKEIQKRARDAVAEVDIVGLNAARENTQGFYSQGSPKVYVRTGQLGRSPQSTGVSGAGNTYRTSVYLDVASTSYPVPNPLFDFDGTGRFSHFTSEEVFEAAENGTSGVLGKPGFWKKTEKEIKDALDDAMSKRFSR